MAVDTNLPTIGMFWVEGSLSFLEQACLLSFVANGHKVVLFHYGGVENVPDEIELVSANEIHEPERFVMNNQFKTPVPQSDIFRLHLMKKTDYLWCDADVLSLAPIPKSDHVFGYQNASTICNAVMRLPTDSPALDDYLAYCQDPFPIFPGIEGQQREELERKKKAGELPHASDQPHSVYGPGAFTWFLRQHGAIDHASPTHVFYPLPFRQTGQANDIHARDFRSTYLKDETLAVHLWGRRMRWWIARGIKRYSFLDRRLRSLGIRPEDAPLPRGRKHGPKPIEFPDDLPALRTSHDAINRATGGHMPVALLCDRQEYLEFAQAQLDIVRNENLYGVNDPPQQGRLRGWDYYQDDASRLNAHALSLFGFAKEHRYLPDLAAPETFTEKLLAMKLFGEIPKHVATDPMSVQNHIPAPDRALLAPGEKMWVSSQPILPADLKLAPGNYRIGTNTGQGQRLRMTWPMEPHAHATVNERLTGWSRSAIPHGFWTAEWWLSTVEPSYFLDSGPFADDQQVDRWAFWVIAGQVQLVQVDRNRGRGQFQMIHDRNFNVVPHELYGPTHSQAELRPERFEDMVRLAASVGQQFEFAIIELNTADDRIYLGEIALCPFGGKRKMRSAELDRALGEAWVATRLFPGR
ncbi:MAG: ATP-grasp fold amidoligase family protein [Pseudomonadota bacterium]